MQNTDQPVVLSIAGHDPGGGAGIQADIETIAALGGTPATAITCLTLQDTVNVQRIAPVESTLVGEQIACVLQDYQVRAIKIGLLGDPEIAVAVGDKLQQHPGIPLVLDPVLAAGGGTELAREGLIEAMQNLLFPHTALITPNSEEARRLTGEQQLGACAAKLLDQGVEAVLITGTHENSEEVVNQLYRPGLGVLALSWPRLEGSYHGSGCTLASAIATGLAAGHSLEEAVERGQQFTWSALKNATHPGRGQAIPNRRHQQEKH
ncbi:MAG: hydroxymethylpyrimidine/phosphomethylpyrimidine kinase [Candidatus Sedimenticola sp. PURPLELP]